MEFSFFLRKHIYRSLETREFGCEAKIKIKLPFVPFLGLQIFAGGCNNEITSVEWSLDDEEFYCRVRDTGPENYDSSYDGVKDVLKYEGWILSKDMPEKMFPS